MKLSSARYRRRKSSQQRRRLFLEQLESRRLLAVITVTSLADNSATDGLVTLREAVLAAETDTSVDGSNAGSGADLIQFSPHLLSSADQFINLTNFTTNSVGRSAFVITTALTIEGPDGDYGISIYGGSKRHFHVTSSGSLKIKNITIEGGYAAGSSSSGGGGGAGLGGAIFNEGTLNIDSSLLKNNLAQGGSEYGNSGGYGGYGNGWESSSITYSCGTWGNDTCYYTVALNGTAGSSGASGAGFSFASGGAGGSAGIGEHGNGGNGQSGTPGGFGSGGGGGGGGAAGDGTYQGNQGGGTGGTGGAGGIGGFGGGGGSGGAGGGAGKSTYGDSGTGTFGTPGLGGSGGAGGFGGGAGSAGANALDWYSSSAGNGGGGAGMGGAVFNNGGTVSIINSTFASNTAYGGSGANPGQGLGGAIFNRNGILAVLNSTFNLNSAGNSAGAIYSLANGTNASATINNSILYSASSTVKDFVANVSGGGVSSSSGLANLIGFHTGFQGVIVSSADPILGGLSDNGGPTSTIEITSSSPAFNAGNNAAASSLTADQRNNNYARVMFGQIDIGAFEVRPVTTLSANTIAENDPAGTSIGSLTVSEPIAGDTYTISLVGGAANNDQFFIEGDQIKASNSFNYEQKPSYTVLVRATNQTGDTFDRLRSISVQNVNEPPSNIVVTPYTLYENAAAGSLAALLNGQDPESSFTSLTYTLVPGVGDEDNSQFYASSFYLRANAGLDYEAKSNYSVRVRATDSAGLYFEKAVSVAILNVNEAPTGIDLSGQVIAENEPSGTVIGEFSTTDPDAADSFIYSFVSGAGDTDNASFTIDADSLKSVAPFDFETKASYSIRVRTTDAEGLTYDQTFAVTVTNSNDPPSALSLSSASVLENQSTGTTIGTFSSTDPDNDISFTYTLVSGTGDTDNASFTIVDDTLKTAASFDFETKSTYSIRIRTTDSSGLFFEQVFVIAITDLDDASPTISSTSPDLTNNGVLVTGTNSLNIIFSEPLAFPLGTIENPAYSAKQILNAYPNSPSGIYWIDPDGVSGAVAPFQVYCDMTTAGGGWMLAINSVAGSESATNDITSNTGSVGLLSGHTRSLDTYFMGAGTGEILHQIDALNVSQGVFGGSYLADSYHQSFSLSDFDFLGTHTNSGLLSGSFGAPFQASPLGNSWFYSGADTTVPASPSNGTSGPQRISGAGVNSYRIWVRETTTPPAVAAPLLGPNSASLYELRNQGADGILGNADDVLTALPAGYVNNVTTLNFAGLSDGVYRLTVLDSLTDTAGNALDGDGNGIAGGVWARDFVVSGVIPTRSLFPEVIASGDQFGFSVASSEDFVVVGAFANDTGAAESGSAYVFSATTGALVVKLTNPTPASNDLFGWSVAVSGNIVVVGAIFDDSTGTDSGSAYVFNATTGQLVATLANPSPATNDQFGSSVAVSGQTVVVGARLDDAGAVDSGRAYVFNASGGAPTATLSNPIPGAGDAFGGSVAISGNTVVVGASADDTTGTDSGSVYVFNTSGGALLATLTNPTPQAGDLFGYSVAVSGSTVVVGAVSDNTGFTDSGIAYVFDASGGPPVATLNNPTPAVNDEFGFSVAVSGNNVVVSAVRDDTSATDSGSAYLFDATTGALVRTLANPTPAGSDLYGYGVGISGNNVAVGARSDDTRTADEGAAYVFSLEPGQSLVSVSGFSFDVDVTSIGTGQLQQGSNNAFDGLNRLQVNGVDYTPLAAQTITTADNNRTVVTPVVAMSGLSVSREITVPNAGSEDFARTIDVFTNSTGSDITVPVRIVGNLGSDGATTVFATSDGDTIVEPTDTWFGTDEADGSGTPAIVHSFRNTYGKVPTNVQVVGDNVVLDYSLTVPAGQTASLAHFTVLATTRATAITAVGALTAGAQFAGQAGQFLTAGEQASLANFTIGFAPTALSLSTTTIDESLPIGTIVGTFTSTDPNLLDAFTYTLASGSGDGDNASFTFDGDGLKTAAVLDFETKTFYSIRVRTTDSTGLFFEQDFTITVNDLDEIAPTVVSVSPSLDDGVLAAGTTSLQITFSEPIVGGDVASNFELRNQGADGILGNADDVLVILSATYSANTTTLNFAGLDEGVFRLTVKDSIADGTGNSLDGDDSGLTGGDDRRDVVVGGIGSQPPTTLLPSIGFGQQGSQFGSSVAVDGDLRVVGAPYADLNGFTDVGVVYVFNATTGALVVTLANPTPASFDYFGYSVAVSGNTVIVGAYRDDTGASNSGSAYVFNATTGALVATLVNPTPASFDNFGYSVAVFGNTVVVGAYSDDTGASESGSAYVFNATNGALLTTLVNPTPASNDQFGFSVAVSGNTVVVGARLDDTGASDSGSAYVFNATTGALVSILTNPTPASGDQFGFSVALSGNIVIVGAIFDDTGASDSGSAYVFNATTGALVAALANPTPRGGDVFGMSVAVSGNTVVVGANGDSYAGVDAIGSAYVFDATNGAIVGTLANPTPASDDYFGFSLAVSGNTIVIGAIFDDTGPSDGGSAYVFNATTGALLATLANPTPAASDTFGYSVAVSANNVVVGARNEDSVASDSGSAYVFNTTTGALVATLANPTPASNDYFGVSVAVSGNTVIVGALFDDTVVSDSGSAFVFDATTGALVATLANPTPASVDYFDYSVAVSGNNVVVGAPFDNTGVSDSGSAYVFNATTGALLATLANPTPAIGDRFGYSVAISGNTVVVGAYSDDIGASDNGSAYVFNATTGELLATLANPTPAIGDGFGFSVAISGNTIVVGALLDDAGATNSGSAYVFNATTGALVATLANPTPATSDIFGSSVAVSGNTAIVGTYADDTGASDGGSAYVFNATTGALLATLGNPTSASGDQFGFSVAVSGNNVVVGAISDDTLNTDQGASYVFKLDANQTLHSASGRLFDVDASSFGTGQLIQGTNNAFDGLNRLQVNNVDYLPLASQSTTTDDNGRTIVTPSVTMSGLAVSREITVPNVGSEDFARTIDVFTNSTGSDITVPVRIVGNLGSDANTVVFATSDGDLIVEPTDTWFAPDDGDGTGSPAIVHLIRSSEGISPTYIDVIGDNVVWDYSLTVPAEQTIRLAHFTVLATSRADAIAAANALVTTTGFAGQAAAFLEPAEIGSLANFVFAKDYGDAPVGYPVAGHLPVGPTLGATRDEELAPQFSVDASGDGADEDGVTFGSMQVGELGVTITVNVAGGGGLLDGWIDFNGDGDWDDAEDRIFNSVAVIDGDNLFSIDVPATAIAGTTFGRFRLSTAGGLGVDDTAADGEVEDYQITILPDTIPTVTLSSALSGPTNATSFEVMIGFDEVVTGLALDADLSLGDILISPAGTTTATLVQVEPKTYRLTVTPTVDGTVTVDVIGGAAFDGAGNGNTASSTLSAQIDRTPPSPVITSLQTSPSHVVPLQFSVDFGEPVSGFSPDEFVVVNGIPSNYTTTDNQVFVFNVSPLPNVTVTVDVPAGIVSDAAGNLSVAATQFSFQTITLDLGDAPAPYPTLLTDDGASHIVGGPRLGASVDFEQDGQPSIAANGDGSDENGVTFGLMKVGNSLAGMNVNLQNAATARVDAWIDFNQDGVWDASEKVLDSAVVFAGLQTLNVVVPATAVVGETYARVRVSSAGGLLPTGQANDGEVKDYRVLITEDVTIDVTSLTSNDITLQSTGTHIEARDNLNGGAVLASVAIATTRSLTIAGGEQNDKVRVDFAAGGFFSLPDGVTFADPAGTDHLMVHGTGSSRATYVSRDSVLGDASVLVRQGTAQSLIHFSGIEPLDITGMQTFGVEGALQVGGETLTIESTLRAALDELTTMDGGTIRSSAGIALGSGESLLGFGTIDATFAGENGSTVSLTGDMTIGRSNAANGFDSRGDVVVGSNTLTLLDANQAVLGSLTSLGSDAVNGTIVASNGVLIDFGNNLVGRGTLDTPNEILKPTVINGAVIGNSAAAGITLEGHIKGVGSLDHVTIEGTYSPGFSPAQVTVGSVVYSADGTTIFELGGTVPGNEHDQIIHEGTATLGGQLVVDWINGFVASSGDEFVLMTATDGIIGQFDSVNLPTVTSGQQWMLIYGDNDVRLRLTQPMDVTAPTGRFNPLPLSTNTGEITLNVTLEDQVGADGVPASGVASYDVFVAVDNGPWTLWMNDVPASQTQLTYQADPDRRYWFRAVATDVAGNVEADSGLAETNTRVLDYAAPVTQVNSVDVDESNGSMTIHFSGADVANAGLKEFQVWVSVDGTAAVPVVGSPINAGTSTGGVHSGSVVYQGMRDGQLHSYRFYSVGVDHRNNVEEIPAAPLDAETTKTFATLAALQATSIDVQSGQTQRSFITHLDVLFNDVAGVADLAANSRLRVERFAVNASPADAGTGAIVNGVSAVSNGNSIRLNFGAGGLGGVKAAGDGFYRVLLDMDGDGQFDDGHFEFFRLFGDTDGNGSVETSDQLGISEDINGDGRIDSRDRRDAKTQLNNAIDAALLSLIDD